MSRVALGCGNFGGIGSAPEFFGHGENEEQAFALMDAALTLGITLFDTADAYGGGRSERWIGKWLAARAGAGARIVLTTKVFHSVAGDPADRGLGGERILRQIEGSLERLGVELVDLYLTHEPDPETPLKETLEALDELVRAGKVAAIGASNIEGWRLKRALAISAERGLARFECVQNSYSLLDRAPEVDVLPVCARHGLAFTAFSPLGGGLLTGKYRPDGPAPPGSRMAVRPGPYGALRTHRTFAGLEQLGAAARERGVTTTALSLAWLLAHPHVTSVILGPRRPEHLEPARAALDLALSQQERDALAALFSQPPDDSAT